MNRLFEAHRLLIEATSTDFIRYLYSEIEWSSRLIGITGARGCGKTTLILQYIKQHYPPHSGEALYVSLDNIWFSSHSLVDLASSFHQMGGKRLFLDEVHKYPSWSVEIKNIYDSYPDMQVVFTGSSLLEIHRGEADLSRRAVLYHLAGLSFREYLIMEHGVRFDAVSVDGIVSRHVELAMSVCERLKPIPAFRAYLDHGYFPFYFEDKTMYHERLLATLNVILEVDLPATERIDYYSIGRIKKLFSILSGLVPYVPNISALSKEIGVTRLSLLNYLSYLHKAQALLLLDKEADGIKVLAKPEKIYLGNTNYAYALGREQTNIGNVRETFFFNQVGVKNRITYSEKVDFAVNRQYNFEIGGRNKTERQLLGVPSAYRALDDMEVGYGNAIPLWLFGFTY